MLVQRYLYPASLAGLFLLFAGIDPITDLVMSMLYILLCIALTKPKLKPHSCLIVWHSLFNTTWKVALYPGEAYQTATCKLLTMIQSIGKPSVHNELPVSVSYIAGTRSVVRPSPPELLVTGGSWWLLGAMSSSRYSSC